MTILAFVVIIIAQIYVTGYVSYTKNSRRVEVQESLRVALNKISRNLRQARVESISVADDGRQINIIMPNGSRSGYRFDAADREVEESISGTWLPVAGNVVDLNFYYDPGTRLANIKIKGEKGNSGVMEFTTSIYIRETP